MSATEVQTNGQMLTNSVIQNGTVTISPTMPGEYASYGSILYWHPWGFYQSGEPRFCIGKAHVFECDHEPVCKCGKVRRVMPKALKGKK